MNKKIRKSVITISVAAMIFGSAVVFSEPGSADDPLVTLSFVEDRIDQIKEYIDVKIANNGGASTSELVVVELQQGEHLIGKSGTEIIPRGGKSTAYGVAVDKGLSDVTDGKDIDNEIDYLPFNHLLIIPRDDGRGAYAVTDSIFMVRGAYEIKK
ncbi:MAG TPA: hypothetical protein VFC79_03285 [Tissierellaceae bacterium]|nr:hypothetical protein [Tissierellaceae bacterium]